MNRLTAPVTIGIALLAAYVAIALVTQSPYLGLAVVVVAWLAIVAWSRTRPH